MEVGSMSPYAVCVHLCMHMCTLATMCVHQMWTVTFALIIFVFSVFELYEHIQIENIYAPYLYITYTLDREFSLYILNLSIMQMPITYTFLLYLICPLYIRTHWTDSSHCTQSVHHTYIRTPITYTFDREFYCTQSVHYTYTYCIHIGQTVFSILIIHHHIYNEQEGSPCTHLVLPLSNH